MPKPEVQIKALEKKMGTVEKKLDALEKIVKSLATKSSDEAVIKLVEKKGLLDEKTAQNLVEKILTGERDKINKQAKADADKMIAESQKLMKQSEKNTLKLVKETIVDTRIKTLEAQIKDLVSKMK